MDYQTGLIYAISSKFSIEQQMATPWGDTFRSWINDCKSNPNILNYRTKKQVVDVAISQAMYDIEQSKTDDPRSMKCVAWSLGCTLYMITSVIPQFKDAYNDLFIESFVLYYNDLGYSPIE